MNQLLGLNTRGCQLLEHGSNAEILSRVEMYPEDVQIFARERLKDEFRRREFGATFGWKHARVTPEYLRGSPLFSQTTFVFIVRNPFAFLNSLYRRPYGLMPRTWADKSEFLRTPILANERDNLERFFVETPVDLWNLKTASYLAASGSVERSLLIRYCDLVEDPQGFLAEVSSLGIGVSARVVIPEDSTKGDDLSFSDYQRIAREYDPRDDFSMDDLRAISSGLDGELCSRLGYERVS